MYCRDGADNCEEVLFEVAYIGSEFAILNRICTDADIATVTEIYHLKRSARDNTITGRRVGDLDPIIFHPTPNEDINAGVQVWGGPDPAGIKSYEIESVR